MCNTSQANLCLFEALLSCIDCFGRIRATCCVQNNLHMMKRLQTCSFGQGDKTKSYFFQQTKKQVASDGLQRSCLTFSRNCCSCELHQCELYHMLQWLSVTCFLSREGQEAHHQAVSLPYASCQSVICFDLTEAGSRQSCWGKCTQQLLPQQATTSFASHIVYCLLFCGLWPCCCKHGSIFCCV